MASVAVLLALTGCGSSGSTKGSATTTGTASVQEFCDDLREVSDQAVPPVGSPMMGDILESFDRLLAEAPAAVRGSVKAADDAAHAQSEKMTAEGTKQLADALKKAEAWASNPKNCPAASSSE